MSFGSVDTLMGRLWGKGLKEGDWPSPLADVQHIEFYVPGESLSPEPADWPLQWLFLIVNLTGFRTTWETDL